MALVGIEPTAEICEKNSGLVNFGETGRHEIRHRTGENDPEVGALYDLARAWPGLPAAARARVVEVLREVLAEVVGEAKR